MITVYGIKCYNPDTNSWIKSINNYNVSENFYKTLNEIFIKTTDKEDTDKKGTETIFFNMYYYEFHGIPGVKIVCYKNKPEHMFFSVNENRAFFSLINDIIPHFHFINGETDHYIFATRTYNKDTYSFDFEFSEMIR